MADARETQPGFYRLVWRQACADWKPTRDRLLWGTIVAFAGIATGVQMTSPWPAILAVSGAAILYLLWLLFRAPAKVWAADQQINAALTAVSGQLEATVAQQAEQLASLRGATARLAELQTQLDVRKKPDLFPDLNEEDGPISVLPIPIESSESESPVSDITVVWAKFNILIVNNDDHPTTILRLWLRVCDPDTDAEITPLNIEEVWPPAEDLMPAVESFKPDNGLIKTRDKQQFELAFTAYYPSDFGRRTRGEKARLITLCVTASGLGTTCRALGEKFFDSRPMRSVNLRSSTSSGQTPPSSSESSE